MKRSAWVALGLVALSAGSAALGWFAHEPKLVVDATARARIRLGVIQQHVEEAEPGSILLAGDSHVELEPPSARLCGAPVVNAGIGGSAASDYDELLSHLDVPFPFRAAVLTIGTNDLYRKDDPLSEATAGKFEKDVGAIVAKLASISERVVVTAMPPIARELDETFEPRAVGAYSERIQALCARIGCLYADPFASLRDGTTGFGLPGVNKSGLHLARYRPVLQNLAATLCPDDAAKP